MYLPFVPDVSALCYSRQCVCSKAGSPHLGRLQHSPHSDCRERGATAVVGVQSSLLYTQEYEATAVVGAELQSPIVFTVYTGI